MTAWRVTVDAPDGFRTTVTIAAAFPADAKGRAVAEVALSLFRDPISLRAVTCVAEPPGLDDCIAELLDGAA